MQVRAVTKVVAYTSSGRICELIECLGQFDCAGGRPARRAIGDGGDVNGSGESPSSVHVVPDAWRCVSPKPGIMMVPAASKTSAVALISGLMSTIFVPSIS